MSVCFIANFSKTYFFHAIAQDLQKHGLKVVWLVNNSKLYHFLKGHYEEEKILYFNRRYMTGERKPVGEFKINELVFGDSVLKYEKENGLRFLTNIQRPFYDFLVEHQVRAVFGETTWAHEVLLHRIVNIQEELNCKYLNPHIIRIPKDRFAFFTNEYQSAIWEFNKKEGFDEIFKLKNSECQGISDKKFKKNSSITARIGRIRRFLTNENIDKNDPTHIINERIRLKTRAGEEWRKETYKKIRRVSFDIIKDQPYILIGLHKQPEASIDVFGRYYEDQLINIQNIWRAMPSGWKLIIKECGNAVGDRNKNFYKQLSSLPNLHFVNEETNSSQLIQNAKLVVTVAGTIAYEAALMQVPALTLAPTFFNRINYCEQINWNELNHCKSLANLCDRLRQKPDNRQEFCDWLWRNSFEGTISSPDFNPAVIQDKNVKLATKGFVQVLSEIIPEFSPIF